MKNKNWKAYFAAFESIKKLNLVNGYLNNTERSSLKLWYMRLKNFLLGFKLAGGMAHWPSSLVDVWEEEKPFFYNVNHLSNDIFKNVFSKILDEIFTLLGQGVLF